MFLLRNYYYFKLVMTTEFVRVVMIFDTHHGEKLCALDQFLYCALIRFITVSLLSFEQRFG